jgi:hypothetical protein
MSNLGEQSELAWCLLIEGVDVAFWDNESAAASVSVGRSATHVGLQPPRFALGCNLLRGWLTEDSVSFKVEDVDGTLRDLFASVRPDDDPIDNALSSTIEAYDTAGTAQTYSKHVGIELFGSSGERNQCPIVEGYTIGPRHMDTAEAIAMAQGQDPITAKPLLWAGRRVALYLFERVDGTWQAWSEASREFWGTLTGKASYHDEQWTLPADGPASWLRKPAGFGAPDHEIRVDEAESRLEPTERTVTVSFDRRKFFGINLAALDTYGSDTQEIAGDSASDVLDALELAISTAKDDVGTSGAWTASGTVGSVSQPNGDAGVKQGNRIWLVMDASVYPGNTQGFMRVTMHAKAWRALGYDPPVQAGLKLTGEDGEFWVGFSEATSPGYWEASLTTAKAEDLAARNGGLYDGDGVERQYRPLWGDGGGVSTLYAGGDQEITLNADDSSSIYLHGQWLFPPAEDPSSTGDAYTFAAGGDVTDARFVAVVGERRADGADDEFDELWVGKMSWRGLSGGKIAPTADDGFRSNLYVSRWFDPARFHAPAQNTDGATWQTDWVANNTGLTLVPLHSVSHVTEDTLGNPARTIRNLLVSSGTSHGWYETNAYSNPAFGSDGVLRPGDNNPSGLNGQHPADRHIEDLSLNIPASMVAEPAYWNAESEGLESGLGGINVVWAGRANLEDVILGIMRPLGWVMTLKGGRYTVETPWTSVSPSGVEINLTIEDYGDDPDRAIDNVPRQDLHAFEPLDAVEFSVGRHPVSGDFADTYKLLANDRGARYRRAGNEVKIESWGYGDGIGTDWRQGLQNRWRKAFAFWGQQHHKITGMRLAYRTDIWPGTVVTVTDPKLVAADGTSLSGALGIVTRVQADGERWTKAVDIVVFESSSDGNWVFAPGAKLVRWDSGSNTAYCHQDWWGASNGGFEHRDVSGFIQQDWMTGTGGLVVEAIQYDGNDYSTAGTNTVSSVDSDANTITFTGAWSGTLYRDRDTYLVPAAFGTQTATWATGHFAPIADDSGEVSGDAANAKKWS